VEFIKVTLISDKRDISLIKLEANCPNVRRYISEINFLTSSQAYVYNSLIEFISAAKVETNVTAALEYTK